MLNQYSRTQLLYGEQAMEKLRGAHVAIFGIGGVGGYVAEALARGKRVVTTDGAPAWEGQAGVVYLKGYRDGTSARRVELLADALARLANP